MQLHGVIDVKEEVLRSFIPSVLDTLLFDRSTRKNILWASDNYAELGAEYQADMQIHEEQISGVYTDLIQPRVAKSISVQDARTKASAEVFTPCWVCNEQNNLVDTQWFGRGDVFNRPDGQTWTATEERVEFPEKASLSWEKYVDARRLEISCGEAPYLVSRYDTVTGEFIPVYKRIGLLDRKLRVVGENTGQKDDWIFWTIRAFQSVYGYEYQGDSLLLARENLLLTFVDYYQERFGAFPETVLLRKIARIISWNIWQMDGLKCVVPNSCTASVYEEITLFGNEKHEEPCPGCSKGDLLAHTGVYCRIYDWRKKKSLPFISMVKGEKK